MRTGFEISIQVSSFYIIPVFLRVGYSIYLGMCFTVFLVITFPDHFSVFYYHTANQGIGGDVAGAFAG